MSPEILVAIIVGVFSLIGVIATLFSSRQSLRLKSQEIELERQKFQSDLNEQKENIEALRQDFLNQITLSGQDQLKGIIQERIKFYPLLWGVVLKYWQHWRYETKPIDLDWANKFLNELYLCNEKSGVYFSQPVYSKFHELRTEILKARKILTIGQGVPPKSINEINKIWFGEPSSPGLSTCMKNDLGSYTNAAIKKPWKLDYIVGDSDPSSILNGDELIPWGP